ncbi:hypothetical protein HDU93_005084 [Gonapodya sp. JEL0774]|nr:hypothetical protein HDU93_005084 [Gonapodya sp. JEL0774]
MDILPTAHYTTLEYLRNLPFKIIPPVLSLVFTILGKPIPEYVQRPIQDGGKFSHAVLAISGEKILGIGLFSTGASGSSVSEGRDMASVDAVACAIGTEEGDRIKEILTIMAKTIKIANMLKKTELPTTIPVAAAGKIQICLSAGCGGKGMLVHVERNANSTMDASAAGGVESRDTSLKSAPGEINQLWR